MVVVLIMSIWRFETKKNILVCPAGHRLSRPTPALLRPQGSARPPPHGSPRCSRRKKRRRRRNRRTGSVERRSPEDGLLGPREGKGSRGWGVPTFLEGVFQSGDLCLVSCLDFSPLFGFHLNGRIFRGGGTLPPPESPFFESAVEHLNLY